MICCCRSLLLSFFSHAAFNSLPRLSKAYKATPTPSTRTDPTLPALPLPVLPLLIVLGPHPTLSFQPVLRLPAPTKPAQTALRYAVLCHTLQLETPLVLAHPHLATGNMDVVLPLPLNSFCCFPLVACPLVAPTSSISYIPL